MTTKSPKKDAAADFWIIKEQSSNSEQEGEPMAEDTIDSDVSSHKTEVVSIKTVTDPKQPEEKSTGLVLPQKQMEQTYCDANMVK